MCTYVHIYNSNTAVDKSYLLVVRESDRRQAPQNTYTLNINIDIHVRVIFEDFYLHVLRESYKAGHYGMPEHTHKYKYEYAYTYTYIYIYIYIYIHTYTYTM